MAVPLGSGVFFLVTGRAYFLYRDVGEFLPRIREVSRADRARSYWLLVVTNIAFGGFCVIYLWRVWSACYVTLGLGDH